MSTVKEITFDGIGELEGIRGCDLGPCILDITKRDIEEGQFNIDITVYVKPGIGEDKVMPPLQKACIDIWGQRQGDYLELFYMPGGSLDVIAGGQRGAFTSFGVTIKHPESAYFNLDRLEKTLIHRIKHHMEKL